VEVCFQPIHTRDIRNESYALAIEVVMTGKVTTYWYSSIKGMTDPIVMEGFGHASAGATVSGVGDG